MAELMSLSPLFPGKNEEDELYLICCILGSPDYSWREGVLLAKKLGFVFPNVRVNISK